MNLSPVTLVTFGIGAVLIYAAVKNKDPRNVVRQSLSGAASSQNPANSASVNAVAQDWTGAAPPVNPRV